MVHDNFKKRVSQESPEFVALMKVLAPLQDHAEEGRRLLCLVNHIMDYYILSEEEDERDVKMPIVYFPLCEEWAQRLCEEFVALKMSVLFGEKARKENERKLKAKPFIDLGGRRNKRETATLTQQFKFKNNLLKNLTTEIQSYPAGENEKCCLYSRSISEQYERSQGLRNYYHFSYDFVGTDLSTEKSLVLLGEDEDALYHQIEENDGEVKIPFIFLFLQKAADGRNTPFCMKMQRSTINEYNEDYNTGIKTVFFFAFSQKPYRLQRVFENKHNLVERLQREKVAETRDFISFTKDEMDYVFGREERSIQIQKVSCEEDSEQFQLKLAFDLLIQDFPHEVKLRNELAICFTERSRRRFKEELINQNPEANEEYIDYFLELLKDRVRNKIAPVLYEWIEFYKIAVVLDFNVDDFYKNQLKEYLVSNCGAATVAFYTFKDLKAQRGDRGLYNSIQERKVLILSMLNHCTGKNWAIYPNSFDQFFFNPGQTALQLINYVVFDPRYSWYEYRYLEQSKLLLNSNYRTKYVKSSIALPPKPINVGAEPKDDEDEQNIGNRQSGRELVRYTFSFNDRQHRTLNEDELLICKNIDEYVICSAADIFRVFDDPTILEVQPLSDFFQPLDELIDSEEQKLGDGESILRNNHKYGLSETEKVSKREMWKMLLEHRVNKNGEKTVYDEIMQPLLPMERIQLSSFRRWLDPSDDSILPRSRRMQRRVLEEYLGIETLYTRLLRHRKSRISTNTEGRNAIFRTFLTHCLLETNADAAYEKLGYDVRDYLNIASGNDITVIVDLIKEDALNLRRVKTIER